MSERIKRIPKAIVWGDDLVDDAGRTLASVYYASVEDMQRIRVWIDQQGDKDYESEDVCG